MQLPGSDTAGPDSDTTGDEETVGNATPLTGFAKIRADRIQVFSDMLDIYDTVHDRSSSKAAVPKIEELSRRIKAIAKESGLLIIAGGNRAAMEFDEMVRAEEIELREFASKRKRIDLNKYPELKQAAQRMGR